jgi:HAD superfamily hydrolase (TIGR01549 family)
MLSPDGVQAIFFDLDGTLRHSLPAGGEVLADCAARLGLEVGPEDRLRAMRWEHFYWANSLDLLNDQRVFQGESRAFWQNYCRRELTALGASRAQGDALSPQVSQYMEEAYHPQSIVPADVVQLLPRLQQAGYRMGVVSNREKPYQQEMESLGIAPYFIFSMAGGEVQAWKPEPDIFFHACRRLDVDPAQAVYVGDNYFADVVGARRAGLQPVLYDPRGIFPEAGCPVLARFDQLPTVLEAL